MKRTIKYYFSEFINESDRLILGYFVHGCLTGMRIGEIQKIKRSQLTEEYVSFVGNKGNKDKNISLIDLDKKVINHEPKLFVEKFSDQYLNRELKIILRAVELQKKLLFTYHDTLLLQIIYELEEVQKKQNFQDIPKLKLQ